MTISIIWVLFLFFLKGLVSWICFRTKKNTSVVSKLRATNLKNVGSSRKSTWSAAWKSEFLVFIKHIVLVDLYKYKVC